MANVWLSNLCESLNEADMFDAIGSSPVISSSLYSSIFGFTTGNGCALHGESTTDNAAKSVPAQTRYHYHCHVAKAGASDVCLFRATESGTIHIQVSWLAGEQIVIQRNTTTVATSAGTYGTSAPHHFYIDVLVADAGGSVTVKMNGVDAVTFSGDTRNGLTGVINRFDHIPNSGTDVYWADFVINDTSGSVNNGYEGVVRVASGLPTANGGSGVAGTPTGAANVWDCYNDPLRALHDGDTTYSEHSAAGTDWLSVPSSAFTGISGTIKAVAWKYNARTPDAGGHTSRGRVKRSGTTTNGASVTVPTAYGLPEQTSFPLDPATGAIWSSFTNLTSAEWGCEMVT